jgi:hypothetical protein
MPAISGGVGNYGRRLLSTKIISIVLARLSIRLLALAQHSILSSYATLDSTLLAGTKKYVSSAYFSISLPGVTVRRSDALTTYDAGPMAEPCMMLAVISSVLEVSP